MAGAAGDEAVDKGKDGTGAGKEAPPPAQQEAKPDKGKPEAPKIEAAKPGKEAAPAPEPKRVRLKDDEDIPEDADILELSQSALKKRLDRFSAKELKAKFGTDDADDIAKRLKEHADFKEGAEKARKEKLDETARLKEEKAAADAKAAAAEARAQAVEDERDVDKQDAQLRDAAATLVNTKYWKHVGRDFAEHMADEHTVKELDAMTDKELLKAFRKWAPEYLKENPAYAAGSTTKEGKPLDESVRTDDEQPNDKGGAKAGEANGKTAKPGQPNSMNRAEYAAHLKKMGIQT